METVENTNIGTIFNRKTFILCSLYIDYMAKTRIKRGNKVYVYERENYRDEFGKVKHKKAQYLGIEETMDGKTRIIPPKKRQKDIKINEGNITDVTTVKQMILDVKRIDTILWANLLKNWI